MFEISAFHLVLFPIIFLIPFIIIKKTSKAKPNPNKLPPRPWKLPIIGNLHQLINSSLPHRSLRHLSNHHGPIMSLQLGQVLTIVVNSKEATKEIMGTHELAFAQRPVTLGMEAMSFAPHGGLVAAPYGDYWRLMRRVAGAKLMSPKRVESFRALREDEAQRLVERVHERATWCAEVDLGEMLLSAVIATVWRAVFGERSRCHEEYVSLLKEVLALSTGFTVADCFPSLEWLGCLTGMKGKLERIRNRASEILDEVINERTMKMKSDEGEDDTLLGALLRLTHSSELAFEVTTDHIKTVVHDIVGAGGETTATALEWAMAEMLRNPRVLQKAQTEVRRALSGKTKISEPDIKGLHYLKSIIKETLRLHPPAPLLGREAREDRHVAGFHVPAKSKVVINAWVLGRDPTLWGSDAESFKPERFVGSSVDLKGIDFEFLPFGAGRRICPGISFSFPSMELVLANLLYHFDWELPNGMKELDMSEEYKISCRRKNTLRLVATIVR